jgi:hypothetical protein
MKKGFAAESGWLKRIIKGAYWDFEKYAACTSDGVCYISDGIETILDAAWRGIR